MATLNHFVYNIRNIAAKGQGNSDDNRLNPRQVEFWINGYRAELIKQFTDFGKNIDPQLVQDLGIVPLQEVDRADPNCSCLNWGCTVKKVELPKFVDFPDSRAVVFIGKIDKQTPIVLGDADVNIYQKATRFAHINSRAFFIGTTLYLELNEHDSEMQYINVRGVFEMPSEVAVWNAEECESVCYDSSKDEYPLPLSMYEAILRKIMTTELNMTLQTVNDELNNAREDNQKLG